MQGVNVQLPSSFAATVYIAQQHEKLILRTDSRTSLKVNETLTVNPDDWLQLRSGDCIRSGNWSLLIHFQLAPKFTPAARPNATSIRVDENEPRSPGGKLQQLPFDSVQETEQFIDPSQLDSTSTTLDSTEKKERHQHPIFDNPDEEGEEICDFSVPAAEEPDLISEMEKLSLPPTPKKKTSKSYVRGKPRRRSNSTPAPASTPVASNDPNKVSLRLLFPSSPGSDETVEEAVIAIPKICVRNVLAKKVLEEELEEENDYSIGNKQVVKARASTTKKQTPKKLKRQKSTSNSRATTKTQKAKPKATQKIYSNTPKPKKTKKLSDSPEIWTQRSCRASATPGRQNPRRCATGKKLSQKELSRLAKESNDALRRMIGEKKS
mgnify:CR=1 FL=1